MKRTILFTLLFLSGVFVFAQPVATLVSDECAGSCGYFSFRFYPFNNKLFYTAETPNDGAELWTSDGTPAGTMLVKDIDIRAGYGSNPATFVAIGGKLFFTAIDNANSRRNLYVTDGSAAGTFAPKPVEVASGIYNFGNKACFLGRQQINDVSLWVSDGTPSGTSPVGPLVPLNVSNVITATEFAGKFYYATVDGKLWVSDGSTIGTGIVLSDTTVNSSLQVLNGKLFFTGYDTTSKLCKLYSSNGTANGTHAIADYSNIFSTLVQNNGKLYYLAYDAVNGTCLYVSDGSTSGTVNLGQVSAQNIGMSCQIYTMTNKVGLIYMKSAWLSDGTLAGTHHCQLPVDPNTLYAQKVAFNDKIYFTAGFSQRDNLWVTDGTTVGSKVLHKNISVVNHNYDNDFAIFNNKLFFEGASSASYPRLDGSYIRYIDTDEQLGTISPKLTTLGGLFDHTIIGNSLYLQANDSVTGYEVWKITEFPASVTSQAIPQQSTLLYPNPAVNSFSINNYNSSNMLVKLYSLTGQLLLLTQQTQNIDVSPLPKGIYIVQVQIDGVNCVAKLVKE